MKTKITLIKTVLLIAVIALITPACSQTSSETKAASSVDAPEMDIHTAVLYGDLEVVKQHIKAGTDINAKEPMAGGTPLISAATFNKIDIAKELIKAGADLEIQNNDGSTALHSAAFFCRVEIVQMLLDADANKSLKNNYGATALESIEGPFAEIKPVYEMMQAQLSPLGMQLDMNDIEKTRPVIAMMLK